MTWKLKRLMEALDEGGDAGGAGAEQPGAEEHHEEQPTMEEIIGKAVGAEGYESNEDEAGGEPGGEPAGGEPGAEGAEPGAEGGEPPEGGAAPEGGEGGEGGGEAGAAEHPEDLTAEDLATPEGVSKRAQARFEKLASGYTEIQGQRDQLQTRNQELEAEVGRVSQESDNIVGAIVNSGLDNDSFNRVLDFSMKVSSGDPAQIEEAGNMLLEQLQHICTVLGKPIGGVDPLAPYPDLLKAVEDLDMTRPHAQELARGRALAEGQRQAAEKRPAAPAGGQQQQPDGQQQLSPEEEQQVQAYVTSVETARNALNAQDAEWRRTDPDYEAKMKRLNAKGADGRSQIEAIVQESPNAPETWLPQVKRLWAAMTPTRKPAPRQAPISSSPAAAGGQEPKTMEEAITQSLEKTAQRRARA